MAHACATVPTTVVSRSHCATLPQCVALSSKQPRQGPNSFQSLEKLIKIFQDSRNTGHQEKSVLYVKKTDVARGR